MSENISSQKRTVILVNIIITCVATTLLMTALSTALPQIDESLQISQSTGQWLISIYSLTMGVTMPLTAFLLRRFPTKWLYISSIGFVVVGLIIAICSVNFPMLLVARVFQAIGNGLLMSMSQVILLRIYPADKRGMAMGWYGLAVGAAPVFAPTLGGLLVVSPFGWRGIFGLTLIIVIIALIMAFIVFENVLDTEIVKFDVPSFILSIFAFGGITLGVGNLASYGITNPMVYIPLAVGVVTAVIFVFRQLNIPNPFLNLRVMKCYQYDLALIASMLLYLVLMGASVLMPLYVQDVKGNNALISGLVLLPGALANAIVSPFAGSLYDHIGIKKLFMPGSFLVLIGCVIMGMININASIVVSSVCYVVRSIAFGCLMMPLITWGTSFVEDSAVADATAMLSSLRTIAGAIGSAVFVGIMTSTAASSSLEGAEAGMHGVNMGFWGMSIVSVLLIIVAFLAKDRKKEAKEKQA